MLITPEELYQAELEAYPKKLADYEWTAKHYPELIAAGWIKKPEPPQRFVPKPYIPGYMRSRKFKQQN